jgi:hypothetical protein
MGEQLSFLPDEPFFACHPPKGSRAEKALLDMLERDIGQADWLHPNPFVGWRLAAAINDLKNLGWQPKAVRVGRVARYGLSQMAKAFYFRMTKGGVDATE